MDFSEQAAFSLNVLRESQFWQRIKELREDVDDDLAEMVINTAADFASDVLAPLNTIGDREGCRLDNGQVRVPSAYHPAWAELGANGWIGIDVPETIGGQGLPLAVQAACETLFDRAAMAFCMLAGSTRSATFVLDAYAEPAVKDLWGPKLSSGEWAATICISEADAGSDVGRIRTQAVEADGIWRISGQKSWISFGGHDLTPRTGHMLLARTGPAETGTRGLSLFLVPDTKDDGSANGVSVERIEEKLGLHGSPTCVLRFDDAEATLIGELNRGLPQLFVMIERMRLLTAGQGAGQAMAAYDIASRYAAERRQGGRPDAAPVFLTEHADVQRQLAEIASRALSVQAFVLELAAILDLSEIEPDASSRADYAAMAAFLLPLAKNFGGEAGFDVASRAIQVLGGAGYTQEWPVEQMLRDARILTIFEGTTGMQALDLLHRRVWKDEARGIAVFLGYLRQEIENTKEKHPALCDVALDIIGRFEVLTGRFSALSTDKQTAEYGADAFLNASWAVVSAWVGLKLAQSGEPRQSAAGALRVHEANAALTQSEARAEWQSALFKPFGVTE